jgi:hypothetical protein
MVMREQWDALAGEAARYESRCLVALRCLPEDHTQGGYVLLLTSDI